MGVKVGLIRFGGGKWMLRRESRALQMLSMCPVTAVFQPLGWLHLPDTCLTFVTLAVRLACWSLQTSAPGVCVALLSPTQEAQRPLACGRGMHVLASVAHVPQHMESMPALPARSLSILPPDVPDYVC